MDKLMDSRLFMKIVALSLALLLFVTVNFDSQNKSGSEGAPTRAGAETIVDVPVTVIYDEENLVVAGVPETVNISIEGPSAIVQSTKALRNFEAYVDLSEAQIGEKRVPIQVRDMSDKLKVTIDPAFANVSVQERVTKEFKIEAEFNQSMIEEGYYAEEPQVEPSVVTVTGAKEDIEKISYVKATIDNRGTINQSITREATVLVLDQQLNKLPVIVEPETVQVTIPVKRSDKVVPIQVEEKGSLPKGITIDSINLGVSEVTITAAAEMLEKVEHVTAELDLTQLTDDVELNVPIIVPDGVVNVDPQTVNIKVRVIKEEEVTISNIPIGMLGLADDLQLTFLDPKKGQTNVTIVGPSKQVRALKVKDFELTVDAANLDVGEHELKINIDGPSNIQWKVTHNNAKVTIVKKET